MFLGFINTKISIKHKLISLNFPLLFLPTSLFFGEKSTLLQFLENKQNSNTHFLCNMGEIQLNQNYLFHMFVTTNKVSNNTNIYFQI